MSSSELSDALNPQFFDQQRPQHTNLSLPTGGHWSEPGSGMDYGQQQDHFAPMQPYGIPDGPQGMYGQGNYGQMMMDFGGPSPSSMTPSPHPNSMAYGQPNFGQNMHQSPVSPVYQEHNPKPFLSGPPPQRPPFDQNPTPNHNYLLSPAESQRFSPPVPMSGHTTLYGRQSLPRSLPSTQASTPVMPEPSSMPFGSQSHKPSRPSSWDPSFLPAATANSSLLAPPPNTPHHPDRQSAQHQRPPRPPMHIPPHNMASAPRGSPASGPILGPRHSMPNVSHSLQRRSPVAQIASSRSHQSDSRVSSPHHNPSNDFVQAFRQENARRSAWEHEHERKQKHLEAQVTELKAMFLQQNSNTQQMTPSPSPSVSTALEGGPPKKKRRTDEKETGLPSRMVEEDDEDDALRRRKQPTMRCASLTHATKLHLFRLMAIDDEQAPLPAFDPSSNRARLDWDKTAKSSAHNNNVKTQVVASLKEEHSTLYPDVPKREFSQKNMEKAFDDVLHALRTKWRAANKPQSSSVATDAKPILKRRGRSASGTGLKKAKLERRLHARKKTGKWSGATFDGCLQVECMSEDEDDEGTSGKTIPWRSTRFVRLLDDLDAESGVVDKAVRREEQGEEEGPGPMPPKGVARWMVSKRWEAQWKGTAEEKMLENLYASDEEQEEDLSMLGSDSESDLSDLEA